MEEKKPPIWLFTDGAASGNPGPGGYGIVLRCEGYHDLPLCILVTALCAFAIWKHKTNIIRLLAHAESKIY